MKFIFLSLLSFSIFASQADNFGLGGRTSARVNGVSAEVHNPYAALYNPALISASEKPLFSFSTSIAKTSFGKMENIYIQRNEERIKEDFQLSDNTTALWALGFTYPFLTPSLFTRSIGIGITLSGPFNRLRSFTSRAPEDIYSLRYGTSDSQFKATLASSLELYPGHLYVGAGVSLFLNSMGNAESHLGQNPTSRMALDVGLESAAVLGILAQWEQTHLALTYHEAIDPTFTQQIEARIPIGDTTFRQPVLLKSSLYYEPQKISFEIQQELESANLSIGIVYQNWKNYTAPILITETTDADGNKRVTQTSSLQLKNTFSPRASLSFPTFENKLILSLGYEYRPTPVEDLSEKSNLLDSNTHIFGLGFEHEISSGELFPHPVKWGLFGQYHLMENRKIEKKEAQSVGGPFYDFSSNTYTYGLFLEAVL